MNNKEFLINLTKELYRLTLLFPKKEPLRYKMREAADEILANYQRIELAGEALEVLDSFFEVAKSQNWVSPAQLLNLQREYSKLKEQSGKKEVEEFKAILLPEKKKSQNNTGINERQERILKFLKENGRIQVWQVKELFPQVSKRTLRRDFNRLFKIGLIERMGERNNTFYQFKKVEQV